jgi:hypothetical protein
LAKMGASVEIAGYSKEKGQKAVEKLKSIALDPAGQQFFAHAADLLTVRGCVGLTTELKARRIQFDYVVLTVGIWPDREQPKTSDGIDKVIALDVLARFIIIEEVKSLLNKGARIMSVLGSTARNPAPPKVDVLKTVVEGSRARPAITQILGTAGVCMDSWLQAASSRHPDIAFVGTFPGVVATDIVQTSNTFPRCLRPILACGQRLVALTPEECGSLHVQILVSPNVQVGRASYFNVLRLEGRKTNPLAYDLDLSNWLWSFLDDVLTKRRAG